MLATITCSGRSNCAVPALLCSPASLPALQASRPSSAASSCCATCRMHTTCGCAACACRWVGLRMHEGARRGGPALLELARLCLPVLNPLSCLGRISLFLAASLLCSPAGGPPVPPGAAALPQLRGAAGAQRRRTPALRLLPPHLLRRRRAVEAHAPGACVRAVGQSTKQCTWLLHLQAICGFDMRPGGALM